MPKPAIFWGSVLLITCLGIFVFPGHSYLSADTQIYVPMMERIYNPVLFFSDPMVTRPHLALTAYDEIAIALRNYAGLDFEHGLKLQQLIFRACAAAGLLLIALRLGLSPPAAFFVAAVVTLNATTLGIGITEPEPIARSFAFGLLLLALGLAASGAELAAGMAVALGFLIHPPTIAPFWCVAAFVVLRRAARPILLAPLLPAIGVLLVLMHFQAGGTEKIDLFRSLDPFQLALQRHYMEFSFISEWEAKRVLDLLAECVVVGAAFWKLGNRLKPPVRDWFWGFAALAAITVPFSWVVLDQLHWAAAGPVDPLRVLVYLGLLAAFLPAVCGLYAGQAGRWWEAAIWFAIALALPVKDYLATWYVNVWLVVATGALIAGATLAACFAGRTRNLSLVAAGILPFIVFSAPSLVPPQKNPDTLELRQLAEWAKTTTDETTVFLFADDGQYGGSGPFRARALRSIYVDYEGRALVNYYARYSIEWMARWRDVRQGHWVVTADDFPDLAQRGINYVVLRSEHAIAGKKPEFSNSRYVVYRVLTGF